MTPGDKLGPYEIVSLLGKGGMGEVWRAHDPRLNRDVAIKLSAKQFTDRFEREAHVIASLNHANVCTLFDIGPNYLVMELVEGPTLADRIAPGPLSLDEALHIAKQIADALEAAHEKGIVHRDLKPANVKIRPDGSVKVLDFGLAKAGEAAPLTPDSPTMMSFPGMILGTAGYMSPEQARGKDVDKRADIFAFGVVLYEMLTAERLFAGETVSDTLAAVIRAEPDLTRVPVKVRRLLVRCLEKDERKRLRDIGDAMPLLDEVSAPADTAPPPPARSNKTGWITAGVLAASLLTSLLMWAPWRDTKPPDQPLVRLDVDLGASVDIASAPGAGSRIILSPDGGRLVYMSQSKLYTRRLDQTTSTELKGADSASAPFFSPDGKWVAFFADGKLKKISVDGGAAIAICDAAGNGGSWGDDGNIVFSPSASDGLAKIPAGGGTPSPVTKLTKEEVTHRWPQVLPGSKAVLFTSHNALNDGFDGANIEVVLVKDGRRKTLQHGGTYGRYLPGVGGPGHLLYANQSTLFAVPFDPDKLELLGTPVPVAQQVATGTGGAAQVDLSRGGTLIYRTGGLQGLVSLQWLDGAGRAEVMPAKPGTYNRVRLSPDGQRLALSIFAGSNRDIWVYEWQRDTMTRLTFGGVNDFPVWTPDGRYLVFAASSGMSWTRSDGAGKPQALTQSKNDFQAPSSFTSDGKRLAFSERPGSGNDLWTLPVESDAAGLRAGKPEVLLQTSFDESLGDFSPDGHWLAYRSNESGTYEIYVRAFPDKGGKWQISNGGGDKPRWSRNGHDLIFQSGQSLMSAAYAVKGDTFVPEKPRLWVANQLSVIVDYDVTPDGKRVVALQRVRASGEQQSTGHVTFLMNFADEVRRRTAAAK